MLRLLFISVSTGEQAVAVLGRVAWTLLGRGTALSLITFALSLAWGSAVESKWEENFDFWTQWVSSSGGPTV